MEFVWVVPRTTLFPKAGAHGLVPLDADGFETQFSAASRDSGFFVERRRAETTPAWKQPIPYVAVCFEDQVFTMTRLTGGEARLHGKRSIGVGGHINPCDFQPQSADPAAAQLLAAACHRELQEELVLPELQSSQFEPLGLLNDDTTEVGAVHVGVVYRLEISAAQASHIRIRETDCLAGEFMQYDTLLDMAREGEVPFESWSSLLLLSGVLAPRASFAELG